MQELCCRYISGVKHLRIFFLSVFSQVVVLFEGFCLLQTRATLMMGEGYTNQAKMDGPWVWSQVKQRLFLNKTSFQVIDR